MSDDDGEVADAGVAGKWGRSVAERGFAQLPNYLLLLNQFLDEDHRLSPIELLVLVQLAAAWWRKGQLPFPSMRTLAVRCGVSERQVQRAVTKLEKIAFLKRVKRRSSGIIASNAYDLSPLVGILDTVSRAYPNAFPRQVETRKLVSKRPLRLSVTRQIPEGPKGAERVVVVSKGDAKSARPKVITVKRADTAPSPKPAAKRAVMLKRPKSE